MTSRAVTVKTMLTPDGRITISAAPVRTRSKKRRRDDVENPDYAAFGRRIIRAHGRRIAEGDVEGLAELLSLRDEPDSATRAAVDGSWGEIAYRLGTTRQAAQQRRRGTFRQRSGGWHGTVPRGRRCRRRRSGACGVHNRL